MTQRPLPTFSTKFRCVRLQNGPMICRSYRGLAATLDLKLIRTRTNTNPYGTVAWPQAKLCTLATLDPFDASALALPPRRGRRDGGRRRDRHHFPMGPGGATRTWTRPPLSSKSTGDSLPTSAGTGAAAPWDLAGKWLAGEQRRAVQRFARLCSYRHSRTHNAQAPTLRRTTVAKEPLTVQGPRDKRGRLSACAK